MDWSSDRPEENLALDEVILDRAEHADPDDLSAGTLRFWESPVYFVVLGTSQVLRQEVNEDACLSDGVPILRRCSAGGCVLQGPGCLNYSLALRYDSVPAVKTLHASYCYVLNSIARALSSRGFAVAHQGICDLAWDGWKISGNAQRRRRHAMLHHGTLLYEINFDAMQRYLREPRERPDYRGARTHREFLKSLPLAAVELRHVIAQAFEVPFAPVSPTEQELDMMRQLAHEKYAAPEWIYRR